MVHKLEKLQAQKQSMKTGVLRSANGGRTIHDDGFDDLYRAIGLRVRQFRKERGFTQKALEEASGVSHASLNQLENRGQRTSISTLYVLAYLLDVSIHDLLPDEIPGLNGDSED